jgi:hypothetical protein
MWRWVKIPKGIALVAFFLPWVTVSCSNRKVMEASGWQLASGNVSLFEGYTAGDSAHANIWIGVALLVTFMGLVLSLGPVRRALAVLITSLVALGTIWIGLRDVRASFLSRHAAEQQHVPYDAAAFSLLRIDWQIGFWLVNAALVVAAILAGIALSGRSISLGKSAPPA